MSVIGDDIAPKQQLKCVIKTVKKRAREREIGERDKESEISIANQKEKVRNPNQKGERETES